MILNIEHQNIILKLGAILLTKTTNDVFEIGCHLQQSGIEAVLTGGFWLYDYKTNDCYYSDKFIKVLGYERSEIPNGVEFFYKTSDVEQLKVGFGMIDSIITDRSEACFINDLLYYTKDNLPINIECVGTVIYKFYEPILVIGTHTVLQ